MASIFDVHPSYTFSTKLLSQFSGERTDPYTRHVAYVLFKEFKLSIRGQRNVSTALSNLPVHLTLDERLSFGWSESNLLHNRAVHEGSYEHLAAMVALTEAFHSTYSAKVLQEMTSIMAGPEDMTPHFQQWKDLLKACNGSFASQDFGVLVEDYVRMDPFSVVAGTTFDVVRIPVQPRAIANALIALGNVSNGKEKQLTLIGSAVIGWFAAVAEWLYDLRIVIFSTAGVQLYASHPGQDTQLLLIFDEKPGVQVSTRPWSQDHVQVSETTSAVYPQSIHTTPFGGRVIWQSLLPKVFGQSFHHLDHEESKTLGTLIGSAARMFQGMTEGDDGEVRKDLISAQNRANPASFGPGLVQTITNWFPELRRFQGRMERALKLSYVDAAKSYVENLSHLRDVCHCRVCYTKPDQDPLVEGVDPTHGFCLTTLVETIIALGLLLSRITIASQLSPSRAGIQSFYSNQVTKRIEARGRHWTEHFTIVYGNEWNAADARRLQNCVQIFSGSLPETYLPENLVAIAHEGICAYFVGLEKQGGSYHDEKVKLIRIVSGGINVRQKVFHRATLGPAVGSHREDPWEEVSCEHVPQSLYCR